jgi:hypothetical protein
MPAGTGYANNGYEAFKNQPLAVRLVEQYTKHAFRATNEDMRHGDIRPELVNSWAQMGMGNFSTPHNVGRKTFIASLQQAILDSPHRVPLTQPTHAHGSVSRLATCSKELANYCVERLKANKPLYLVNKSILSTRVAKIGVGMFVFKPSTTAVIPRNPDAPAPSDEITFNMTGILLRSDTPVINVAKLAADSKTTIGVESESEIMVPAGRIFQVMSCCENWGGNDYDLSLTEVTPEEVPMDAVVCTNIL